MTVPSSWLDGNVKTAMATEPEGRPSGWETVAVVNDPAKATTQTR